MAKFFSESRLLCRPSYLSGLIAFSRYISDKQLVLIQEQINKSEVAITPQAKVIGNEGHVYIYGPLVSDPDPYLILYSFWSTTYQSIQNDIDELASNNEVEKFVFHFNSPGGMVEGVDDTWKAIMSLRDKYEVIAINEGDMASGAYWLASAANKIIATSETNEQGSIGVISSYTDWTKYDEELGIKEKIFTSKNAKYKHVSQDGFDDKLQKTLDDLEEIFVSRISAGRGLTKEHIYANFGEGSMLLAKDAQAVGMIDEIRNFRDQDKPVANNKQNKGASKHMTLEEMLNDPGVQAEIAKREAKAEQAGRNDMLDEVKKAMPFLNSDKYTEHVKNIALQVCEGSVSSKTLDAIVNYEDQLIALDAAKKAEQDKDNLQPLPGTKPNFGKQERSIEDRVNALKGSN